MNENTPGISFSGFLIMMLMPRLMKGLEKSMTRSRTEEIVSGATAMSATYKENNEATLVAKKPCKEIVRTIVMVAFIRYSKPQKINIQTCTKITEIHKMKVMEWK